MFNVKAGFVSRSIAVLGIMVLVACGGGGGRGSSHNTDTNGSGDGSMTSPYVLTVGDLHSGTNGGIYNSYSAYYSFLTNTAGIYTISLTEQSGDFSWHIYADEFTGSPIKSCDNYWNSSDETCEVTLDNPATVYYLQVRNWDSAEGGSFNVLIEEIASEGVMSPIALTLSSTHNGMVNGNSSSYYSFTPRVTETYNIALSNITSTVDVNVYDNASYTGPPMVTCSGLSGDSGCRLDNLQAFVTYYLSVTETMDLDATFGITPAFWSGSVYDFNNGLVPAEFSLTGDADWYIDTGTLRSGAITDNGLTCFAVSQYADFSIQFDYSVDSEADYDYFKFYVDNLLEGTWSGSIAWQTEQVQVTSGIHDFKWCYSKDGGYSVGADAAWVDNIIIN